MTSTIDVQDLADVQNEIESRGVALNRVGIKNLNYPLIIRQRDGADQRVAANIDLLVGLHEQQRGAHLSSLVEVLERYRTVVLNVRDLVELVHGLRVAQDARGRVLDSAEVRIRFKYFLPKPAPATGVT